ncbi:MAG: serine/threonine protein kinase, partial [Armatimonadetes bacterium]|nr:serine/threonine protein kinase [Anaerolineae bacterium]
NILIDAEGHALLADFGIAKITSSGSNLTGTAVVGTPAYMAPEQAQGMSDARADIYSLGVVVFEMLTGKPPYASENTMQLMLAHVQAPIPSVLVSGANIPVALEPVMLRVLAKDPDDRYTTATDFAEDFSRALHQGDSLAAVHRTLPLAPQQPLLPVTPIMPLPTQTGFSTDMLTPVQPTIIVQQTGASNQTLLIGFASLALLIVGGVAALLFYASQNTPPFLDLTGIAQQTTPIGTTQVVSATDQPTAVVDARPSFGELSFGKSADVGDSVSLRLENVRMPSEGKVYIAWLQNSETDAWLPLSRASVDALGKGGLNYTDPEGAILPTQYNMVIITEEDIDVTADVKPSGEIKYSGSFSPAVLDMLTQIFIASEQGWRGEGLLASASREADFASQHAGYAAGAKSIGGVYTHAEHTINILRGTKDDLDNNGSGSNPGTGIGLYKFVDTIDAVVATAVTAPGATPLLQSNAENIRVCTANVRAWSDRIIEIETGFLAATDMAATEVNMEESTTLAAQLKPGFDQNDNGQVEPFENECGLQQIESFGLLVASITVYEGDVTVLDLE